METADASLACWLMLCSDLAIRSGTAARLGPENYDPGRQTITFRTKYENAQSLPVTTALAALFARCPDAQKPFVVQLAAGQNSGSYSSLAHQFARLRKRVGITRKLTPHDLRRTTARDVYTLTGDLRMVQALLGHSEPATTMWYLQDATTRVPQKVLELAKLNPATEVIQ